MPYVIAPLDKVKGLNQWDEYRQGMMDVEKQAVARAVALWTGAQRGGVFPLGAQFGVGPFRKNDMAGDTSDSTPSGTYTFRKNITATAWQDLFNYSVRKDMIHAFVGFLITDDVLRVIQWRFRLGQVSFPIIDVQEAQRYDRFAIILKTDRGTELVVDPNTSVLVRMYAETVGWQRVVPLGLQIYRRTDLVLNEV